MNPLQKFNELNQLFSLDFTEGTRQSSIGVEFTDNFVYKAKTNFVNGSVGNATNESTGLNSVTSSIYDTLQYGYTRVFCNKSKVRGISIDAGISYYGSDSPTMVRNINLDASFLKQFPSLKKFYFRHYGYSRDFPSLTGKVTGDWSAGFSPDMEYFDMPTVDYPNTTASFNLNNIPGNSKLLYLALGGYAPSAINSNMTVSGDLSHIPTFCTKVILGADRAGTTNTVSGVIPSWVNYFVRTGRNTIAGDLSNISNDLQYITLTGLNVLEGNLKDFPLCTNFNVQGNNKIGGNIKSMPLCETFTVIGNNKISGTIPALPSIKTINILGNNELTSIIPTMLKLTSITIGGNSNTISGTSNQPVCTTFQISGTSHNISGDFLQNLPAVTVVYISSKNAPVTYTKKKWAASMIRVAIQASNTLTTAMVDQLLIDLAETTWSTTGTNNTITISGTSGARSNNPTINKAVQDLVDKHVTVVTNK